MNAPHPAQSICLICGEPADLYDVVDFNKNCEEVRGHYLPLSGHPVYYQRCTYCYFTHAPEFLQWTHADFAKHIYNDDYAQVDRDYESARPAQNMRLLQQLFGEHKGTIRHLDFGGGKGVLAQGLCQLGWNSLSYDPFANPDARLAPDQRFDLITAFEVLEHAPDPNAWVSQLLDLMEKPCMVLFSTLLADRHIKSNERLTWWYAAPRNGHISLYTQRSLALLAKKHDLRFGTFGEGMHCFFNELPGWAAHLFEDAQTA